MPSLSVLNFTEYFFEDMQFAYFALKHGSCCIPGKLDYIMNLPGVLLRTLIVFDNNGGPLAVESQNGFLCLQPVEGYNVIDDGSYSGRDVHHLAARPAI